MPKAVLISIRPKWCEKIARGEKTVEVRKTCPKLETPFKCYIYCTMDHPYISVSCGELDKPNYRTNTVGRCNGKVIGEFTCDRITPLFNVCTDNWHHLVGDVHEWHKELVKRACLTDAELKAYAKGQNCFAWHISNLKIYDMPKELTEFRTWKKCKSCSKSGYESTACIYDENCMVPVAITKAPQSWCYVEELK